MRTCMSVRNHESQYTHLGGLQFAPMTLYDEPFKSPISFSSEPGGPSPAFSRHIYMPSLGPTVSLLIGHELVVNSSERFLLFTPKLPELTFKQTFFPTDESHSVVVLKQVGKAHKLQLGSMLVGLNPPTTAMDTSVFKPQDFSTVNCFYYQQGFTLTQLNRIGFLVIQHMRRTLPSLMPQVRAAQLSSSSSIGAIVSFKATMTFPPTEIMSRIMGPSSSAAALPAKRQKTTETAAVVVAADAALID